MTDQAFLDQDFSTFIPDEEEEGEEEEIEGKEGGEGVARWVAEEAGVAAPGEATSGDANPQV